MGKKIDEFDKLLRLNFNINNSAYDLIWLNGYNAEQEGEKEETNPYKKNQPEHKIWKEGWWAGFEKQVDVAQIHEDSLESSRKFNPNNEKSHHKRNPR